MKLKNLINEELSYCEKIATEIFSKCQKFIQESKNEPLYRGMSNIENDLIQKKKIRTDRSVSTFHTTVTDKLEDLMKRDGFKAIRTNSVLCTGNRKLANDFGKVHRIFIIENYDYTWSPSIEDYTSLNLYNTKEVEYFWENENDYIKTDLYRAIESYNEILISGTEYYAILKKHTDYENLMNIINEMIR